MDPNNRRLQQKGMVMMTIGIVAVCASIIAIAVLWGVFYIGACLLCGGVIMIILGLKQVHQAKQNIARVHVIDMQGSTTQRITYGQASVSQQVMFGQVPPPAYSGPPPPVGGWQNDPYPPAPPGFGQGPPGLAPDSGYVQTAPDHLLPPTYGEAMSPSYAQPPDRTSYSQATAPSEEMTHSYTQPMTAAYEDRTHLEAPPLGGYGIKQQHPTYD